MKFFRNCFFVVLISCFAFNSHAQNSTAADTGSKINFNQTDAKGKRDGMWYIHQPARMGEDSYSEFGSYDHGIKFGKWYKTDNDGELVAIETFKNNVLNGEVKYFDKGHLYCVGHYRGLNPSQKYDTVMVVDPVTGAQSLVSVLAERGSLKHGTWQYYDPLTGRLEKEQEYQVDDLVYSKEFAMASVDSAYYKKKVQMLPHNAASGHYYKPPAGKQHSLTGTSE
ncbi:toxin-antitoxin system YwqK family antitoxin [Taibaiella soli]|uniref:Toxin-antitoxin system YwqK family antitoxin n=1 Tax=Taibaiella soli TaxID=1649169 RepID=A0A2W2BD95_9BACT|nr:hypothetical protein [Taibaiella soli]PZF74219.1 hypothetical protein DN068_04165 [Taibaiella soli]